jgi:hypothetical protein
MATEKDLPYILSTPNVPGGKNYITTLNVETGSTVTYDVTAPLQKDAVLRSDVQIVNGERIYVTQFVPDKDGNLPSGAEGKYLSETVAKEADKQRADFYLREAPQTGQDLNIPGVKNTATSTETGDANQNAELTKFDQGDKDNVNKGIETKINRTEYENLKYPLNLSTSEQDVVQFTMFSYGLRKVDFPTLGKRDFNKKINGSVTLSIQPRISDSNTVSWNDSTMSALQGAAVGGSLGFIEGGFAQTEQDIEKLKTIFQGSEGSTLSTALKAFFAQSATGTQNLFSRLTGGIVNPNLELLFENPDLRVFNYSFQLSPREPQEAIAIKKIIRFFKQGMAVQRSEAELFLKAPNVFEIRYLLPGEQDHPYLNRIKKCALTNCSVDYTPTGSYMTFAGNEKSMVSYNLSLTFKELEPIYADDYTEKIDGGKPNATITSIGY